MVPSDARAIKKNGAEEKVKINGNALADAFLSAAIPTDFIHLRIKTMSPSPNFYENPLRHWLPSTSLSALRQEMSDMLEGVFGDSMPQLRGTPLPRIDVAETADAVEITTDVPGYQREEIQIEIDDKSLTISGSQAEEQKTDNEERKYHRLERRSGNFSRTVWLPCPVDEQKIDARLLNGTLKIHLPKVAAACRRKIEIKGDEPSASSPAT